MDAARIRVLLIEDNPGDARLIERMLAEASAPPCEMAWADTLAAGAERLAGWQPHVVLLDLGLPGSSGLDTLRRFLAQAPAPAAPALIVLSGLNDEDVALESVKSGAQDYLVKGRIDQPVLVRAIRYAIERSQAREALRRAHDELELRVVERTAELAQTVSALHAQIADRERAEQQLKQSQQMLRELAARGETVREQERKALTREIHDEMGQYLSALRMGVSVIGLQFGAGQPELAEKTRALIELIDSSIKVVRNVVASLRPSALDMGIVSALEWLVEEFTGRSATPCSLRVDDEMALDEKRATELFRIVQESLTNISRHAQASAVRIVLDRFDDQYVLEVRDNGRGFDPAMRKVKSFGLIGLRERALVLGGEARVDSAPGAGTLVKVSFPVNMAMDER